MKLTTKGTYALKALLDITRNSAGLPVKLEEVHERQNIPLSYLQQIFKKLKDKDVVRSYRGTGGGYMLNNDATVKDALIAVGDFSEYADRFDLSSREGQLLGSLFKKADNAIARTLSKKINKLAGISG